MKKINSLIVFACALFLFLINAHGQAYTGFSASGKTNATGSHTSTSLQWGIIPATFTGTPVVKFMHGRIYGVDITNAAAYAKIYTASPRESAETKITTATSAATNIVADAGFTNGIVADDIVVHWAKATDTYSRLRVVGPSATVTGISVWETTTTASGDKLYKMNAPIVFPVSVAAPQTITFAVTRAFDFSLSGDLAVGPVGRPILGEIVGTNSPTLSVITALPYK